jgi:hypothetical protein
MAQTYSERAPFNDWWYWSECLVKRFRTIAEIYRENNEMDRANEAGLWVKNLQEACAPPVELIRKGLKTEEQKSEAKQLEETAINRSAALFRELLVNLPFISKAMQDFLYVKWEECAWEEEEKAEEIDENTGLPKPKKKKVKTDGRVTELFWGPKLRTDEGIRSGKVEDGGLPGILYNLMVAEKTTSSRAMQASVTQQRVATAKMANRMSPGRI